MRNFGLYNHHVNVLVAWFLRCHCWMIVFCLRVCNCFYGCKLWDEIWWCGSLLKIRSCDIITQDTSRARFFNGVIKKLELLSKNDCNVTSEHQWVIMMIHRHTTCFSLYGNKNSSIQWLTTHRLTIPQQRIHPIPQDQAIRKMWMPTIINIQPPRQYRWIHIQQPRQYRWINIQTTMPIEVFRRELRRQYRWINIQTTMPIEVFHRELLRQLQPGLLEQLQLQQ
jgi:hypothetical protein